MNGTPRIRPLTAFLAGLGLGLAMVLGAALVCRRLASYLSPISYLRPSWEAAECRLTPGMAGKGIAFYSQTGLLRDLLVAQKVEEFNRARRGLPFADQVLQLSTASRPLNLAGLDLGGADLSDCLLEGAVFTACDLREASFRNSSLVRARFYQPTALMNLPSGRLARPTRLDGADFTGAAFQEIAPGGRAAVPHPLQYTDPAGAAGVPPSFAAPFAELARAVEDESPQRARAFLAGPPGAVRASAVGVPCENPFRQVPQDDYKAWLDLGVEVGALAALKAIRVDGQLDGEALVNPDPATVLVVGSPFRGRPDIYSVGPLVVEEEAVLEGGVFGGSVVWFRDESLPRGIAFGRPIVLDRSVDAREGSAVLSAVVRAPAPAGPAEPGEWVVRILRERSLQAVARALGGTDPSGRESASWLQPADLKALMPPAAWSALLQQRPTVAGLRAVSLRGEHLEESGDVIQPDPDAVLVLEKGFSTRGSVFAAGPVVALGEHAARDLLSRRWIVLCGPVNVRRLAAVEGVTRLSPP